MNFDLKV